MKKLNPAAWIIVFSLMTIFLVSCAKNDGNTSKIVRPVRTLVIPEPGTGRERTFSGTAKAAMETDLSFRVSGEISALPAKIGMKINKGDLIAQLDPIDHEIQVKQLEAQLAQMEAQLKQSRADYERARSLYEAGNVSKSDLDSSQAFFESARAQKISTEKSLDLTRQQLEYCSLKAPAQGIIAAVPVEVHQTVQAGQTIARIASEGEMEMEIGIPEALIARIRPGDAVYVTFDAIPNTRFKASVIEVGVAITRSSTYPVKLQILQKDDRIKSGMVGEATFTLASDAAAGLITIPPVAVAANPDGSRYVWLYRHESGTVSRKNVQTGALTSKGLQIKSGLKAGEIIVIRGVHRLHEGMKVRLLKGE